MALATKKGEGNKADYPKTESRKKEEHGEGKDGISKEAKEVGEI